MERVAMTALEADVLKLAIAALGVLAVALVLIVYFGSRGVMGILGAQASLLKAYQEIAVAIHQLTVTLTGLANEIRLFQQSQTAAVAAIHGDLRLHFSQTEERHKTIVEQIEEASQEQVARFETLKTDIEGVAGRLIDSSVQRIEQSVGTAVQPVLDGFGVIRTSIEQIELRRIEREAEFKRQRDAAEAQYQADIQAIWDKVAETQQSFVQTVGNTLIMARGASENENVQQTVERGSDLPDTGLLVDPGNRAGQSDRSADGAAAGDDSAAPGSASGAAASDSTGGDAADKSNDPE